MPPAKKLQVFVSSTYTDLRAERQAAVEAILSSGHIPAGMELFAAGDESQMDVIRRWIDESDVFLLILGGRYGSIEPSAGKSYIHLEYEYATQNGKPLFAVVLDDAALEKRLRKVGRTVIETENAAKLREFRDIVQSKIVSYWSDVRDIKLAIHETMSEYARRSDLIGWIPGDQAISTGVLAEVARLTKENNELRNRLAASGGEQVVFSGGLSFDELRELLQREDVDLNNYRPEEVAKLQEIGQRFGDSSPSLVHVLWRVQDQLLEEDGVTTGEDDQWYRDYRRLEFYGLISLDRTTTQPYPVSLRTAGRNFLILMRTKLR